MNESGQFDSEVRSYQLWQAWVATNEVYNHGLTLDEFTKICDEIFGGKNG